MKKVVHTKTLTVFVFLTFICSAIFVIYKIVANTTDYVNDEYSRERSDYVLMLLQCVLGAIAMLLPGFIKRKVQLNIPTKMIFVYALFLYCGIYLGEVRSFYYIIPHWDSILHAISSMALCTIGFSLIAFLNNSENVPVSLSPAFIALFALCFAVTVGTVWEIYEFSADLILHTNMQKYALENGTALIGQAALIDTMKDICLDVAGATIVSIIGYNLTKHREGWLDELQMKQYTSETVEGSM